MPLRNQFDTEADWLTHLRIYFAAQALNAIPLRDWSFITDDAQKIAAWASAAYAAADAMLTARGDV